MNFSVIFENLPQLLDGVGVTLELVGVSLLIGACIALPMALMRVSRNPALKTFAYGYIFFFRGTPLLVQIFLIYYGASQFPSVRDSFLWPILREAYWCAIIAFALNTGAYTAEILRGAIQAVPAGQIEAARAIGMTRAKMYRRIILPQAFRIGLPAYGNEIILMLKGSALASTITLLDLTGMARTIIARTYMPVELFFAAGVIYFILTAILTQVLKRVERRVNRHMTTANT
ncbi:ABC transporter permease [Varunaivibrio sulfuroxidans]|uniref:Glutamate/aspartate import permease protein GltK n=1 Tax=Varunaivibrio sulfuroxidans TaxID=1773489 RepID=A0A4R3JAL3_9PROT|nr:ABC transporter permease [Varunaivibrio sulfuroxidans]TCS62607.1 amino acid ABC transporter membrane protein 2 (PAAT family) [Varunaivibrio sulfuroxidans]WES30725.1 ABC transporter permease [Varunaivibrio sulfuroxidans]